MQKPHIIFICHGSICRSPAAEFIMKNLSSDYEVVSRAVSYEEIGNDIYPPMKIALRKANISFDYHAAKHISNEDYAWADYIFYMDKENFYRLNRLFPNSDKLFPIYEWTPSINEIEDPWYTGNYDKVVRQINECVKDIIKKLER